MGVYDGFSSFPNDINRKINDIDQENDIILIEKKWDEFKKNIKDQKDNVYYWLGGSIGFIFILIIFWISIFRLSDEQIENNERYPYIIIIFFIYPFLFYLIIAPFYTSIYFFKKVQNKISKFDDENEDINLDDENDNLSLQGASRIKKFNIDIHEVFFSICITIIGLLSIYVFYGFVFFSNEEIKKDIIKKESLPIIVIILGAFPSIILNANIMGTIDSNLKENN